MSVISSKIGFFEQETNTLQEKQQKTSTKNREENPSKNF